MCFYGRFDRHAASIQLRMEAGMDYSDDMNLKEFLANYKGQDRLVGGRAEK